MNLWPHQETGADWLVERRRGILGDEQGMGKTVTALEAAKRLGPNSALVVCSLSKIKDWTEHIRDWLGEEAQVVKGTVPEKWDGWLVCTYKRVAMDRGALSWADLVIADEAHKVRNRKTALFEGLREVCGKRKPVFLLTATPTLNHRMEIWTLLYLCDPEMFKSYWKVAQYYFKVRRTKWGHWEIGGLQKPNEWRRLLEHMVLSRYHPGTTHTRVNRRRVVHTLKGGQLMAYEDITEEHKLTEITRQIQAAIHPALIDPEYQGPSKLDTLQEVLDERPSKAIVFTRQAETVRLICQKIPGLVPLTGSMSATARGNSVDALFKDARGLAITHGAGGEGLNLTAADRAIFMDLAWHPGGNLQALGRIDRPGQESDNVECILIHSEGTVEDAVFDLVKDKEPVSVEAILRRMG